MTKIPPPVDWEGEYDIVLLYNEIDDTAWDDYKLNNLLAIEIFC